MQVWVSCFGRPTAACDPHAGGDKCGEQRAPDLQPQHNNSQGRQAKPCTSLLFFTVMIKMNVIDQNARRKIGTVRTSSDGAKFPH